MFNELKKNIIYHDQETGNKIPDETIKLHYIVLNLRTKIPELYEENY